MPKYMISVDVTSTNGTQTFSVEADSPKEAIEKFKESGGEFESEEIEVMNIDTESIVESDLWIED